MSSFAVVITDSSEGRMIRMPWVGSDGYGFLYSLTPEDVRRFKKGVAFLARVFLRGGARRVIPLIHNRELRTLEDVDRFERAPLRAGDIDCMGFHPLGTCRMAASAAQGVVDPDHQVFGAPGLYVCDGSVVPSALGVNPQLTIMALATRFAMRLLARGKPA